MNDDIEIPVDDMDITGGDDIPVDDMDITGGDDIPIPVNPEYIPGRDGVTFTPQLAKEGRATTLSFVNNGQKPNPPPALILDGKDGEGKTILIGTESEPVYISQITTPGEYVIKGNILELPDGVEIRPGDFASLTVQAAGDEVMYQLVYSGNIAYAKIGVII
jgi:hypothetical protein